MDPIGETLVSLKIEFCGVGILERNLFRNLTRLRHLSLISLTLEELNYSMFEDLLCLQTLEINSKHLNKIEP